MAPIKKPAPEVVSPPPPVPVAEEPKKKVVAKAVVVKDEAKAVPKEVVKETPPVKEVPKEDVVEDKEVVEDVFNGINMGRKMIKNLGYKLHYKEAKQYDWRHRNVF